MLGELETILIGCVPALIAILTNISTLISIFKSLGKLKENEQLKIERDKLLEQNKILVAECRKMRKQVALLVQKVAHITYNDMSEVKNDEDLQV